jgi:hypothetical protein
VVGQFATCLPNSCGHAVTVLQALLTVHDAVVKTELVNPVMEHPEVVVHCEDVAAAVVLPAVFTPKLIKSVQSVTVTVEQVDEDAEEDGDLDGSFVGSEEYVGFPSYPMLHKSAPFP